VNVIKYIQKYLLQHPRKAPSSYNQKHAEIWHKGRIAGFHEAIQWVLTWQYIPKDGVKRTVIEENDRECRRPTPCLCLDWYGECVHYGKKVSAAKEKPTWCKVKRIIIEEEQEEVVRNAKN
jgi:hypothetical protein